MVTTQLTTIDLYIFTNCQRTCRKVIFSQVSVILFRLRVCLVAGLFLVLGSMSFNEKLGRISMVQCPFREVQCPWYQVLFGGRVYKLPGVEATAATGMHATGILYCETYFRKNVVPVGCFHSLVTVPADVTPVLSFLFGCVGTSRSLSSHIVTRNDNSNGQPNVHC